MKKKKKEASAETHPELKGLDIRVNEFGELVTNISLDRLNDFLDRHVLDKKLNEEEWEERKKKSPVWMPPERRQKRKGKNNPHDCPAVLPGKFQPVNIAPYAYATTNRFFSFPQAIFPGCGFGVS